MHMIESSSLSNPVESHNKSLPCHWVVTLCGLVSKERTIGQGVIDADVSVEGTEWVSRSVLSCPMHFLSCKTGFCAWEEEHFSVQAIVVSVIVHASMRDVLCWAK